MFIVYDREMRPTTTNDIKDVGEIVLTITGKEFAADYARRAAGYMALGEWYERDGIRIECVSEAEASARTKASA